MMREREKGKTLLLICLTALLFGSTAVSNVRSNPGTPNMYVDPPTKLDTGLSPGSYFTVTIKISNVERMWAFSAFLRWGDPLLEVSSVTQVGQFLEPGGTVNKLTKLEQSEGTLFVMASLSGEDATPQTGSGTLFTVQFLVEGWGASVLDLYETKVQILPLIGQPEAAEHTTEDGFFSNVLPAHYDIKITNVTTSKTIVGVGFQVYISITLENQGNLTTAFPVNPYYNSSLNPIGLGQTVTVSSGASTTITITWDTTYVAKGIHTIIVKAYILPNETNTADNTFIDGTVRVNLVGDIKEEFGIVDIFDLVYVAGAFGAKRMPNGTYWHTPPGDYCPHDPNTDINGDGVIDIFDIVLVAAHYGEKDP